MDGDVSFASRLRWWRERGGFSQLKLAIEADVSQRHVSFLELGRTKPSREMVLRLAVALDVPLRQRNTLLAAAGFVPIWRETNLDAPELAAIRKALDYILAQQEPYPAVVVDRQWKAQSQCRYGPVRRIPGRAIVPWYFGVNFADALVGPDILRPFLVNWEAVVRYFIRTVEADAVATAPPRPLLYWNGYWLILMCARYSKRRWWSTRRPCAAHAFPKDQVALNLFTTLTNSGAPQDITLQELRIESFFAMDDATAKTFRAWAEPMA